MIQIVRGKSWRECQCCHSSENVIEVYFRDDGGQGTCVSLCENCRRLLANLLIELTEKDERELSEDCEDCQEYDSEKHCCPRYCKVIRETVDELNANAPKWNPIKSRPMDEEERKEWSEWLGFDLGDDESVIYTSQLPDDGDEVMTCNLYGTVEMDIFHDDGDGVYFENNGDMDGIVAWMPKPKPYKPSKEDSDAE